MQEQVVANFLMARKNFLMKFVVYGGEINWVRSDWGKFFVAFVLLLL